MLGVKGQSNSGSSAFLNQTEDAALAFAVACWPSRSPAAAGPPAVPSLPLKGLLQGLRSFFSPWSRWALGKTWGESGWKMKGERERRQCGGTYFLVTLGPCLGALTRAVLHARPAAGFAEGSTRLARLRAPLEQHVTSSGQAVLSPHCRSTLTSNSNWFSFYLGVRLPSSSFKEPNEANVKRAVRKTRGKRKGWDPLRRDFSSPRSPGAGKKHTAILSERGSPRSRRPRAVLELDERAPWKNWKTSQHCFFFQKFCFECLHFSVRNTHPKGSRGFVPIGLEVVPRVSRSKAREGRAREGKAERRSSWLTLKKRRRQTCTSSQGFLRAETLPLF